MESLAGVIDWFVGRVWEEWRTAGWVAKGSRRNGERSTKLVYIVVGMEGRAVCPVFVVRRYSRGANIVFEKEGRWNMDAHTDAYTDACNE